MSSHVVTNAIRNMGHCADHVPSRKTNVQADKHTGPMWFEDDTGQHVSWYKYQASPTQYLDLFFATTQATRI